ncbi:hypothetical protein Tco_0793012 [Tanacetum coccineum]
MRTNELYKFCNGTLKSVRQILHERVQNFKLGYNKGMPRRKWTDKDQNRSRIMVNLIDDKLLERRIMQSLEVLVGGRHLLSVQDEALQGRLFDSFQDEGKYEHVVPKVTRLQKGKIHNDVELNLKLCFPCIRMDQEDNVKKIDVQ